MQQQSSLSAQPSDSLPNGGKLDIGAKLVRTDAQGNHTVHITVVRDPIHAKGQFDYQEGTVVISALKEWAGLWEAGAGVPCAGVAVHNGGDLVAQGSFCGTSS